MATETELKKDLLVQTACSKIEQSNSRKESDGLVDEHEEKEISFEVMISRIQEIRILEDRKHHKRNEVFSLMNQRGESNKSWGTKVYEKEENKGKTSLVGSKMNSAELATPYKRNSLEHTVKRQNSLEHTARRCNSLGHTVRKRNSLEHTDKRRNSLEDTVRTFAKVKIHEGQIDNGAFSFW